MRVPLTIFAAVVSGLAFASRAQAAEASVLCHQLNLAPTAEGDCEQQMGSARTDADRAKVIRTFATGLASARADTMIGQFSSPAPAAKPTKARAPAAAKAAAQKSPSAAAQDIAVPQQKTTTAAGADLTGTKAKPQRTQTAPADQPPARAKAQKTSHQPPAKSAKKNGQ